jgi:hypothetical protein
MEEIRNKVAQSGIITIDLEQLLPQGDYIIFDIKPHLFQELILKEKDFREFIKTNNWQNYTGKFIALTCTADAIVPTWAYMLLMIALKPFAAKVIFGSLKDLENSMLEEAILKLNLEDYKDARIVVKGCGEKALPVNTYVALTNKLMPVAKSIMYGEPCSTVPLYKAPK